VLGFDAEAGVRIPASNRRLLERVSPRHCPILAEAREPPSIDDVA
jgi:hypothetical protein